MAVTAKVGKVAIMGFTENILVEIGCVRAAIGERLRGTAYSRSHWEKPKRRRRLNKLGGIDAETGRTATTISYVALRRMSNRLVVTVCTISIGRPKPMFTTAEADACRRLLELALQEDLGANGDLTSLAVIPPNLPGRAALVVRSAGVVAGLPAAQQTFSIIDPQLSFQIMLPDGSAVSAGAVLAVVSGSMRSILAGERTALNFLQRLSGVATATALYVKAAANPRCKVLDTRKTTPGWRVLEKYAVRCGGGHNHRMGLGDGILIKDNHLAALGGGTNAVAEAVRLARQKYGAAFPLEIEVDDLIQFDAALAARPDIVLLDNMNPDQLREAVRRRNATAPGVQLEASGGVTLITIHSIAETGVDRVSVGALTHSAPALDIGLDYKLDGEW